MMHRRKCWGVLWRGAEQCLLGDSKQPHRALLFETRKAARAFIRENYGYIRIRKDLRKAPHWWRMPLAVRVEVSVKTI